MARISVFGVIAHAYPPMTLGARRNTKASCDRAHRESAEPHIYRSDDRREQMAEPAA